MEELIMVGIKRRFSKARELCVGMSDEIYALTDYISVVVNDSLAPMGLVTCFRCVLDDIEKGRCSFANKTEVPEIFIKRKEQVKSQFPYLVQVVDEIADEDFAEEFRILCKALLRYDPPKRIDGEVDEKYLDCVKAAADIMVGVKRRFSKARELCVGMSDEIYVLTDYISVVVNDSVSPIGLVTCFGCVLDDIEKGRCGFANKTEIPEIFIKRKELVKAQFPYLVQVVDEIADEDFAEEFRILCKALLRYDPPKRIVVEVDEKYPDYVKAAVDWWANAILSPKLDNGEELPEMLTGLISHSANSYTLEQIKLFKDTLAEGIMEKMKERSVCEISVDYHPCLILAKAGEKIGVPGMIGYPWKTDMIIEENIVKVSAGYGESYKTIWSRNF